MVFAAKRVKPLSVALFLLGALIVGEVLARVWLGLGTPPIYVTHPTIEYMYKPDQDVVRFGNRQLYNELGMRSFPLKSFKKREVVMVFGDSVVNGGSPTDHEKLATSLLTNDSVVFANISAGSWGPQNMAAYWMEFRKRLPYKKAVLVLSSHDLTDIPTFEPLDPTTHPTQTPFSALLEGAYRYLPRYFPAKWTEKPRTTEELPPASNSRLGEQMVHKLIDQFKRDGIALCVVRHYTLAEMKYHPEAGDAGLKTALGMHFVPIVDIRKHYPSSIPKETFFRDNIHFNDAGQTILAKAIAECARFIE